MIKLLITNNIIATLIEKNIQQLPANKMLKHITDLMLFVQSEDHIGYEKHQASPEARKRTEPQSQRSQKQAWSVRGLPAGANLLVLPA